MPLFLIILLLTGCAQRSGVSLWMSQTSADHIDYSNVRTKMKNTENLDK